MTHSLHESHSYERKMVNRRLLSEALIHKHGRSSIFITAPYPRDYYTDAETHLRPAPMCTCKQASGQTSALQSC